MAILFAPVPSREFPKNNCCKSSPCIFRKRISHKYTSLTIDHLPTNKTLPIFNDCLVVLILCIFLSLTLCLFYCTKKPVDHLGKNRVIVARLKRSPFKIKGRFLNIMRFHRLSFLFLILLVQKRLYECFSHQGILLFFSVLFHSLHHFDRLMIQNRFPKNFLH